MTEKEMWAAYIQENPCGRAQCHTAYQWGSCVCHKDDPRFCSTFYGRGVRNMPVRREKEIGA